jgi:hydrogenase nickel incorporation protein HypA/HybF
MHELSIALSILDVAAEEAAKQAGARVRAVHLRLGLLSGVVQRALLSAFEMAREDSPLVGAELIVEEVPIRIRCPRCQAERPVVSIQELVCSECGAASAEVTQGRELEVVALEIE